MKKQMDFIAILLVSILLGGCAVIESATTREPLPTPLPPLENTDIIAEGRIVPRDYSNLFFIPGGTVSEILVQEGDTVNTDQALIRLKDQEQAEAALAAAQAEQLAAQQALDDLNEKARLQFELARTALLEAEMAYTNAWEALDKLDTQPTQDKIDDARSEVVDRQDELDEQEETLQKYSDLAEDHATRKRAQDNVDNARQRYNEAVRKRDRLIQELEIARAHFDLAEARLEDARLEFEMRQSGQPNPDDISLAQARLDHALAQVKAAEAAQSQLELRAPFSGVVVNVLISEGEPVGPGQVVLVLADLSEWYIETVDLHERDVVKIRAGQTAAILPDALPETVLSGEIETIGQYPEQRGGDVVYRVRLRLLQSEPRLRWGMTVDVNFSED